MLADFTWAESAASQTRTGNSEGFEYSSFDMVGRSARVAGAARSSMGDLTPSTWIAGHVAALVTSRTTRTPSSPMTT